MFLWNFNQMVVMNFWKVKIETCFQKSFWNDFFSICQNSFAQWVDIWNI